jgi:hypothetical protein
MAMHNHWQYGNAMKDSLTICSRAYGAADASAVIKGAPPSPAATLRCRRSATLKASLNNAHLRLRSLAIC